MSILEAHNISKSFGGIRALDSCSITTDVISKKEEMAETEEGV